MTVYNFQKNVCNASHDFQTLAELPSLISTTLPLYVLAALHIFLVFRVYCSPLLPAFYIAVSSTWNSLLFHLVRFLLTCHFLRKASPNPAIHVWSHHHTSETLKTTPLVAFIITHNHLFSVCLPLQNSLKSQKQGLCLITSPPVNARYNAYFIV